MKNLTPIVAHIIIDGEATTIPALNVSELYDALNKYAKETEEEHIEWMAALPSQEEVQKKVDAMKGKTNTQVINDHPIGDWGEYFSIELMPQLWVDRLISPFVSQIRKLGNTLNSMIGHPENPFGEHILNDLVAESFELIKEPRPKLTKYEEK